MDVNDDVQAVSPQPRIGVALGGGSARGYAHIGALASLETHGFAPDVIVGTSFGALIGALYASGQSLESISASAHAQRRRDLFWQVLDFGLHKAALFGGKRLELYFEQLTEGRRFKDLEREFAVVATDADTGERVILKRGSLARALRASVAMPGIFAPIEYEGRRLIDGGIGAPVPIGTLDEMEVDVAIGIEAGIEQSDSAAIRATQRFLSTKIGRNLHRRMRDHTGTHPYRVLGRALAHTATSYSSDGVSPDGSLRIHTRPPINWLNFHRAGEAIEAGATAVEELIPDIRRTCEAFAKAA